MQIFPLTNPNSIVQKRSGGSRYTLDVRAQGKCAQDTRNMSFINKTGFFIGLDKELTPLEIL